jgi:signal transduction histidine kinase
MKFPERALQIALIIAVVVIAMLWAFSFEWKPVEEWDIEDVFFEGIYLSFALLTLMLIMRLRIQPLTLGWGLFVIGLEINFLDELTHEPDLISLQLEGVMITLGLVVIAYGIYTAYRRLQLSNRALEMEIRRRQRTEEESKMMSEDLALLNRILTHDISNDLAVISGNLDLYEKKPEERYLMNLKERIKHTFSLINDVRTSESIISDSGGVRAVELSAKIREAVLQFGSEAEIESNIHERICVLADEAVSSIIGNILINAVMHSDHDRAKVIITSSLVDGKLLLRIADDGPGILDEFKEKVFEAGYSTRGGGGIGLHIVRRAMQRYCGDVWVEDNSPRGSVFVLRFRNC